MAGERMKPGNFVEMTAVCVHPDHRGRGYAQALLAAFRSAMPEAIEVFVREERERLAEGTEPSSR